MGQLIKHFPDGSFLEYDRGGFDDWCVYLTDASGKRKPPRDIDYFAQLRSLAERFGKGRVSPYYCTETEMLFLGDTFSVLKKLAPSSVDMVFADPPYFLSNDGITCHAGQMVSVNKGDWDKISSVSEKHTFNRKWIRLCKEVLSPNGTIKGRHRKWENPSLTTYRWGGKMP